MSSFEVPGAKLYYEVSGDGPLLVLIPGASGDGEAFRQIVPPLAARFQVVIYDRRGFSRSELEGEQDFSHRLVSDVEDVRRMIEHLTERPAILFGNSSGAIVALEGLTRYPNLVDRVVAHEPPAVMLLPDSAQWLAFFDAVYATYCQAGVPRAMHQFASGTGSLDHPLMKRFMKGEISQRFLANAGYWMEHELRQYPRVELDLDALMEHKPQLVLAGGQDSRDQMTYQPNQALAQRLGLKIIDFPGGHLGFLRYPAEFAQCLIVTLKTRAAGVLE